MIKRSDILILKAISLCFKPFLKPEEACIYTNLGRTQLAAKCEEFGVYKTKAGYYKKSDLDNMLNGIPVINNNGTKKWEDRNNQNEFA